jgi:hypothetical protein
MVENGERGLRSRFSVVFLFSIEWIHCRKISIWGSFVVQWLSSQCQPLWMRFNWCALYRAKSVGEDAALFKRNLS